MESSGLWSNSLHNAPTITSDRFENDQETIYLTDSDDEELKSSASDMEIIYVKPPIVDHPIQESPHIPSGDLKRLIAEAIISSPEGNLDEDGIVDYSLKKHPMNDSLATSIKQLVVNSLENNVDIFMRYVREINGTFVSGFWTLRPLAAATFVQKDKVENISKQNQANSMSQNRHRGVFDEKLKNNPVVQLQRLPFIHNCASKLSATEMDIIPSSDVVNALKNHGISIETHWGGWSSFSTSQENKITKLENFIKRHSNSETSKTKAEYQKPKHKSTSLSYSCQSQLKKTSLKRNRPSDSSSDLETSDNDSLPDKSSVHKEHNYVASKDSPASTNLIESLRKIVQKMDKDTNRKSTPDSTRCGRPSIQINNEKEDFLGFDHDSSSGYWRGWEKASSRNSDKLKEIIRGLEGSRNLEEVLEESFMAVERYLKSSESLDHKSEDKLWNRKSDTISRIEMYYKELMALFDHMPEEPPVSYVVLTIMAVCADPKISPTEDEICQFIRQHFPFHCRGDVERMVEVVLHLGSPDIFVSQKSRRPAGASTNWSVDHTTACEILERALHSAKTSSENSPKNFKAEKTTEGKPTTNEDKLKFDDVQVSKRRQEEVLDKSSLTSSFQSIQTNQKPKNDLRCINKIQLHGKRHLSPEEVAVKRLKTNTEVCDKQASDGKSLNNIRDTVIVPLPLVPLKSGSNNFPTNIERDDSQCSVKNLGNDVFDEVINKSSNQNSSVEINFDSRLDLASISNYLQAREKLNLNNKDCVTHRDSLQGVNNTKPGFEKSFDGNLHSPSKSTSLDTDKNIKCCFLLRYPENAAESSQQPCYICHKTYGSHHVLNIHFAQKHFGQSNVHVRSSLCLKQIKEAREIKKSSLEPSENRCDTKDADYQINIKNDAQSKNTGNSVRYRCKYCIAIFHHSKTLHMHTVLFHQDENVLSNIPLKKVSTGGSQFYYCDKCSGCFHTVKDLAVHSCQPF